MSKLDASDLVAALGMAAAFVSEPETWPVFREWLATGQRAIEDAGDITRDQFQVYVGDALKLSNMLAEAESAISALTGGQL